MCVGDRKREGTVRWGSGGGGDGSSGLQVEQEGSKRGREAVRGAEGHRSSEGGIEAVRGPGRWQEGQGKDNGQR